MFFFWKYACVRACVWCGTGLCVRVYACVCACVWCDTGLYVRVCACVCACIKDILPPLECATSCISSANTGLNLPEQKVFSTRKSDQAVQRQKTRANLKLPPTLDLVPRIRAFTWGSNSRELEQTLPTAQNWPDMTKMNVSLKSIRRDTKRWTEANSM